MVTQEKRALTMDDIESQTALALPDRELMALINIVIFDVLNNVTVTIPINVQNNHVAVGICAQVNALTAPALFTVRCDVVA